MAKTYGQFCALARALDHVGDRWTLLVVRELLLGDASYGDLVAALGAVPTNLLADRLRQLEADGLVERDVDPHDRRRAVYRLTPLGRGLEPVVFELIRWGAHWMRAGPGDDRFDPRWAALALRALLEGRIAPVRGIVDLLVEGGPLRVVGPGGRRPVRLERGADAPPPDATVDGHPGLLLAVASGQLTLAGAARRGGLRVRGDRAIARALLEPAE